MTTDNQSLTQSASGLSTSAKDNQLINGLERELVDRFPPVECPVVNTFTPGLYSRKTTMPAGSIVTSKIHKTEHQFVVLAGRCKVYTEEAGVVEYKAGDSGITKPGTRRVLVMLETTTWMTFHPTDETDIGVIEEQIIEPHDIPSYKLLAEEQ